MMKTRSLGTLLLAIMLLNHLLGTLISGAYFLWVDRQPLSAILLFLRRGDQLTWLAVLGVGAILAASYLWLYRYVLPLKSWLADASSALNEVVLLRMLNLPRIVFVITVLHWLLVSGLFGFLALRAGFSLARVAGLFLGMLIVSGLGTALFMHHVVESMMHPFLEQHFQLESLENLAMRRSRLPIRLLFLWVQVGMFPLVLFAGMAWLGMQENVRQSWELHLRQMWFLVAIAGVGSPVAFTMVWRTIVAPLDRLIEAMQRVWQVNDLSLRLPLRSLDEFGRLSAGFNRMLAKLQEYQRVREILGRYISSEVAEQVIQQDAWLQSQEAEASVLFVDLRGFTHRAECQEPTRVMAMLNQFFDLLIPVVIRHEGLVNKFGGDSILAVFGVPLAHADHADRAVRAAVEMLHAVDEFNLDCSSRGVQPIQVGIGIATGRVVAGNVGSQYRMEYTVLGDAVNLAQRLEALTRTWRKDLLISGATWGALTGEYQRHFDHLGEFQVSGRRSGVVIYAWEPISEALRDGGQQAAAVLLVESRLRTSQGKI